MNNKAESKLKIRGGEIKENKIRIETFRICLAAERRENNDFPANQGTKRSFSLSFSHKA